MDRPPGEKAGYYVAAVYREKVSGARRRIFALREVGVSVARTAELAERSIAQGMRVTALHRARSSPLQLKPPA